MHYLVVELGKTSTISLRFGIRHTPIANAWLEKMHGRQSWPLDDPTRFYGFDSLEQEITRAKEKINHCIDVINSHQPIVQRQFTSVYDQDLLNYLHNIFERYHGLLDQQNNEWWSSAPVPVRQALAELNVAVHRCESLQSGNPPRLVCTWYGMPKTDTVDHSIMQQYGTMQIAFGTVCLNYVEIGKTLEDLAHDQDKYIDDSAFRPFNHYSADFVIAFYDCDHSEKLPVMQQYFSEHQNFFESRGIQSINDVRVLPLRFPVADLVDQRSPDQILELIKQHQYVKTVTIE